MCFIRNYIQGRKLLRPTEFDILAYLLKARTVEAKQQPFASNGPTHATDERVTYAVTSRNSRRGIVSGFLYGSAQRSLLHRCAVNTPLQG
jgi:hypothetical protein